MKNKEIRDELEKIAPSFLSKLDKEPGFRIPHNYFDQLSDEVLSKMREEKPALDNSKVPFSTWIEDILQIFSTLLRPRLVAGLATIVLLLIGGLFFLRKGATNGEQPFLTDLSAEEIQLYLTENIEEIDEELLIEISTIQPRFDLFDPVELGEEQLEDLIDELDDELLEELL